jgi:hypothetical protein
MSVNSDFKELLLLFNAYHVKYLLIGGYAVIYYAEPRYTKDLDLWVSTEPENAAAVFSALQKFGAPLREMTPDDFAQEGYFYQMGVPPVRVDILMSVGDLSFAQAWENRVCMDFDGVSVWVIGKDDLIASKKASGRPQDLLDIESLSQSLSIDPSSTKKDL